MKRLREEARAIGRFASRTLHDYETTASVLPSSRFLTRAMLAPLDFGSARAIVELGPGTGALTRQILERMSPQATLYAIELDEVLAKGLANEVRDPRLQVIHGSAVDVRTLLSARGVTTVDAVISSLGLSLFPEDLRQAVLHAAVDVLRPDGVLTQYSYLHARYAAFSLSRREFAPWHARPFLEGHFHSVVSQFVGLNVPPAVAYACRAPRRARSEATVS